MATLFIKEDDTTVIDTMLGSGPYAAFPFGTDVAIALGVLDDGSVSLWRGMMRYDLSALAGATIDDTTLTLYHTGETNSNDDFSVYRVTRDDWDEDTATWNKYDAVNDWTTPGGDYDGTVWATTHIEGPNSYDFDLTDILQDAIDNRSGILNFIIIGTETTGTNLFLAGSSSANDPADYPELSITYHYGFTAVAEGGMSVGGQATADYEAQAVPSEDVVVCTSLLCKKTTCVSMVIYRGAYIPAFTICYFGNTVSNLLNR